MDVQDDRARWTGQLAGRERLEIRFQKPFLPRVWEGLAEFFGRPVVQL
jgi:hypothetical protein